MKKMRFSQASGPRWDELLAAVRQEKPDQLYIFAETEWEFNIPIMFAKICKALNVEIKIVHGCFDSAYHQNLYRQFNGDIAYKNVEFWPTMWTHWAAHCLQTQYDYVHHQTDTSKFKYHFISLNNKGHDHRAALVDHLAKYELLDKGIVTWNKFINDGSGYDWEYFDNRQLVLNDNFYAMQDSFLIPEQYHDCLLHVVGEATQTVPFITEKTILPMLYRKPLVLIGSCNINRYLEKLGFRLFPELIDYAFDAQFELKDRADMLALELKKLTERKESLQELYESVRPTIEHNYNRIQEIIHDPDTIPSMVKEFVYYSKEHSLPMGDPYGKFIQFMKNCRLLND